MNYWIFSWEWHWASPKLNRCRVIHSVSVYLGESQQSGPGSIGCRNKNSFVIQRSSDGRTDGMREESAERKEERRESNQPTNQPTDQPIERPYTKLFWLRVISGIVVKSSCQFSLV